MFEDAEFLGFLLDFLQVFLLPDVDGYCYDLGFVFFLEPLDEDGRVQSARVSEYDFFCYGVAPPFFGFGFSRYLTAGTLKLCDFFVT